MAIEIGGLVGSLAIRRAVRAKAAYGRIARRQDHCLRRFRLLLPYDARHPPTAAVARLETQGGRPKPPPFPSSKLNCLSLRPIPVEDNLPDLLECCGLRRFGLRQSVAGSTYLLLVRNGLVDGVEREQFVQAPYAICWGPCTSLAFPSSEAAFPQCRF
jgi:hypothetical protein